MNVIERISVVEEITQINIDRAPTDGAFLCRLWSLLAAQGIDVDMICRPLVAASHSQLSFTVSDAQLRQTVEQLGRLKQQHPQLRYSASTSNGKITVHGGQLNGSCGVAAAVFNALCTVNADILLVTTGSTEISLLLASEQVQQAAAAISLLCQKDGE